MNSIFDIVDRWVDTTMDDRVLDQHCVSYSEENPGVDRFYMTFVQLTTGGGGWPMSVFLTPDLQPFMGATYFPPEDKFGRPGFKTILTRIAQIWTASPEKLKQAGKNTVAQLKAYVEVSDGCL